MKWLVLAILAGCGAGEDTVSVEEGTLHGTLDVGVRSFLGVPYAAPPVGALRFASPQPPAHYGSRDATQQPNGCMQKQLPIFEYQYFDEDCLYLDVWTPRPAPKNAPVMVFIHGGAFLAGSIGEPLWDGTNLAKQGVVIVSMNYRLGPFGYLVLGGTTGTQGIEDQRAAMKWVQKNVARFGGDPTNVTLFGESAGAISTMLHVAAPESKGLFVRAIAESAPMPSPIFQTHDNAVALGQMLAQKLGCSDIDCLRQKDPGAILNAIPLPSLQLGTLHAQASTFFAPLVDNPRAALAAAPHVPVIIGTNRDEGTLFESMVTPTESDYQKACSDEFGANTGPSIYAKYPSATYGTPKLAASAVLGDSFFVCDTRRTTRALYAGGGPTWRYSFEMMPSVEPVRGLGVYHAAELRFVFDSTYLGMGLSDAEVPLSQRMQADWLSFARTGAPGADWPQYDASDPYFLYNSTIVQMSGLKSALCDFWDTIPQ
jgi:para-nitrobenzyl esterase